MEAHITISSDRPQPRELDGDVIAAADTLDVTVRPGALWLCVPQPRGGSGPELAPRPRRFGILGWCGLDRGVCLVDRPRLRG